MFVRSSWAISEVPVGSIRTRFEASDKRGKTSYSTTLHYRCYSEKSMYLRERSAPSLLFYRARG